MKTLVLCMEVTALPAGDIRVSVEWDKIFLSIPVENRVFILGQVIKMMTASMQQELSHDISSVSELVMRPGVGLVQLHLPIEDEHSTSEQSSLAFSGCFENAENRCKATALTVCIQYLTKLGIAWVKNHESAAV